MTLKSNDSPYLVYPNRLADVLAAIQAMGTYRFYKLDFAGWADRISGDSRLANHWKAVFEQHPEFFRIDQTKQKASLVWRRQKQKCRVDDGEILTKKNLAEMSRDAELLKRVSRTALSAEDVHALMRIAIDLHARAVEQQREKRWWLNLATAMAALVGSLVGASLGA